MPGTQLASFITQPLPDQNLSSLLSLQSHQISHIGIVPNKFASRIRLLNLKNNHLKSIDGIAQFISLETLDLSFNKIASTQSLFQLKHLLNLKRLYLKGNPFLQSPLSEQTLTFLGGFQNDLQILNFAFVNDSRETLINQYKKSKIQSSQLSCNSKVSIHSKISENSKALNYSKYSEKSKFLEKQQSKSSKNLQAQIPLQKSMEVSKYIQTNKANILLMNMKEFIEQGHESQQISSQSINGQSNDQNSFIVEAKNRLLRENKVIEITPMKKNPKFNQIVAEDQVLSEADHTKKFQEESTGLKMRNLNKSNAIFLDYLFSSNQSSAMATTQQKFTELKSQTSQNLSHDFRKSPSKQYKYQVDNMNIKMQLDSVNLNCPSIIEREDHDSYEIQFDFISPERCSRKVSPSSKAQPAHEIKENVSSFMKISDHQITLNAYENKNIKTQFSKQSKSPRIQTPKIASQTLSSLVSRKDEARQANSIAQSFQKQNIIQNSENKRQQQLFLSKRGSLHQSIRYLIPQTNKTTGSQLMGKILMGRHQKTQNDSVSFSAGLSLEDLIENGQKFQKFYYNSLTKLKPVFNLLYSPFSSLNADEKDMLLQELFKNHKQIFILFLREFHAKQQLQEQLSFKDSQINSHTQQNQQLNDKIQFLGEKLNSYSEKIDDLQSIIQTLETENAKLKKESGQFNQILSTRQKIINDVKLEYEKANKTVAKKDHLIQKFLNQDQVQQELQRIHQKNIKKHYFALVNQKAFKIMKLHQFQRKKKIKDERAEQKRNHQIKIIVFKAFLTNYHKQKGLQNLFARTNAHLLRDFFDEWKIEVCLEKKLSKVQRLIHDARKNEFLETLRNYSLEKQRDRKIKNFEQIRLKKKVFFQGFKRLKDEQKKQRIQSIEKALKFNRSKVLKSYFQMLKFSRSILNAEREENQRKIQTVIIKRQFSLLRRLIRCQKKQEESLSQQVKNNVIKLMQSRLLLQMMKQNYQRNSRFRKGLKVAIKYRLQKIFKGFKSITGRAINKYKKIKPLIYKFVQQQRLKTLVIKFRQNNLTHKVQKNQKDQFLQSFRKFHLIKTVYSLKETQLQCFLNFRRGFKAKNNFISALRHINVLRKIKSKQINLSEHYQMQDEKYKEGHELNMFTLDQLKAQINTHLNEINCYKVQVQILAQRQQFLLDQKQNCLLEIQSREEQTFELKTILIENEKKLHELERKYEKSLDMYAVAMSEAEQKSAVIEKGKSSFLYDTIAGSRSTATFRRDANETTFTSLKR